MIMPAATPSVRWNRAMLEALPEDGQRHEIVDGAHYVPPSPAPVHQYIVSELLAALVPWCKAERAGWVFTAPSDIELAADTIVQPDITIFPKKGGPGARGQGPGARGQALGTAEKHRGKPRREGRTVASFLAPGP